ncbi:U11/U12 small nuclear ribonucleoprotein 65 kDa protein [Neltuma alba]|uniref:U11/U12 small nuclear ribonucleoprotein 65 kDa protein n=1 Tax=Neltuma alba TaxID=207710 RepID=UPI0010A2C4F4|nr:U11/U12 small nuclear ribonucleoprotein 65 kDa protein-like [Prosopis alba]
MIILYVDENSICIALHPLVIANMDQFGFQVTEAPESKPSAGESPVTLLIKHLPEAISHETLSRLLSHFGASSIRPCSSGRLRNCAFVDFKNDMLASQAHRQLNGLRFLSKVLSVERASNPIENSKKSSGSQLGKDSKSSVVKNATVSKSLNDNSKSGAPPSEPIAARLGVDYPFPPHLEYAYPPPDGNILTNIVNALIAVPRFYTQVLHLMNKMNIPAPFRMALPTPPLPAQVPAPPPPPPPPPSITMKPQTADLSSSESEMESSDDEVDGKMGSIGLARAAKSGQKRARHETIIGPAIDKDVAHEAVGVKPATLVPKEIPMIKKRNPVLQIKIAPKAVQSEHKDDNTTEELMEPEKETLGPKEFLTPEELKSGKLPPEEILSLPMFKNYTAGNPAPVLYIKNLAKDVIADDFYFIFGSLFGSTEAARSTLQVKLMQEGRMRGQAFLTFPSIELAQHALNLVNGYVFKGKPMIIQFGRNTAAAKGT